MDEPAPVCPGCGSKDVSKLFSPVAFQVKSDVAEQRVGKRLRSYLIDGKYKDAIRFADKAASILKSDKVKRMAEEVRKRRPKSPGK